MLTRIIFPTKETHSIFGQTRHVNATVFVVLILAAYAAAQPVSTALQQPMDTTDAVAANVTPAPYIAEIIGNDVYVRSGPGTNYYFCGKLNKGDRVEVVGTQVGWSRIIPPAGCFSWLSMRCVSINLDDPTTGIVTGEGVRVYAGSDYVEPMHSTSDQVRLSRGEKIKLLGEEKDGYYKIVSPSGAYLWVSSQYIQSVAVDTPEVAPVTLVQDASLPAEPNVAAPVEVTIEAKKIEEFRALHDRLEAERAKPLSKQNFVEIKEALTKIAGNKDSGKAARYAEAALSIVGRCELAQTVVRELELQDKQLQQTEQRIDKAYATRLEQIKDLGRFAVIGHFQGSSIYGAEPQSRRYRIVDEDGKTICYAVAAGQAGQMNLAQFMDKKVGLVGSIKPHQPLGGALVEFTNITELK